jgi:hypothetical protein
MFFKLKGMVIVIKLIIWLAIPFFLWYLPATFFDDGQSFCPSKFLLNKECLGCGITRSIQHAIHFEFEMAWKFNWLFVIVLPILVYIWIKTSVNLYNLFKIQKNNYDI